MKPRKARARVVDAYSIDSDCTIVLSTRKIVRGTITDIRTDVDAHGAPGEMVAGRTAITLIVQLHS